MTSPVQIRLTQPVTLRSEPLPAGAELDVDAITAAQLIAAGQAETATVDGEKPAKTESTDQE